MSDPEAELQKRLLMMREDPVLFVRAMFDVEPQRWEADALGALATHDRISIRSGHGVGKTALLSWAILWWLLTHYPVKAACTANTASQLQHVLWPEIAKWARRLPQFFADQLLIKSDKIELVGGVESFAVARTSRKEQPEALQGFHSPNMLFVVDEASGVPDIVFEVAQGAMSTAGAKTLMVGNPTRASGFFYDSFHKSASMWVNYKVSCVDAETTVDKKFIEEMQQQYGVDSNVYRVRVLGEFPQEDDDVVIPLHLVESAQERDVEPINSNVVWGLDVARFGDDRTALCKRRSNAVIQPIKTWRNKDLMQICGLIVAEYENAEFKDRPTEICVDAIGLGAGVVDRLRELDFGPIINGINVAESPAIKDKYAKQRDELWFAARDWLELRQCKLPKDNDLLAELTDVRYSYLSSGKLKIESKNETKKRGRPSPDVADAFVLTFASRAVTTSGRDHAFTKTLPYNTEWIV